MKLIDSIETYIAEHNIDMSPEEMFVQFEHIKREHIDFERYLRDENLNQHLEKMQRDKRLLEKRKLFVNWYVQQNQNDMMIKELLIDLSEILFTATRTVKRDIKEAVLKDTTAQDV